jgi:hypothetical protein
LCQERFVSPAQPTASFVFILIGYHPVILNNSFLTKHNFVAALGGVKNNSMRSLTLALHEVRDLLEPRAEESVPVFTAQAAFWECW